MNGVTHAPLDQRTLQSESMPFQMIWERIALDWDTAVTLPDAIAVCQPTVYRSADGRYWYSHLAITTVDQPLQVFGTTPRAYVLRAYIEHRYHGQPSAASRAGERYVAHVRNERLWFVADDAAMTLRRERPQFLPDVCFHLLRCCVTPGLP